MTAAVSLTVSLNLPWWDIDNLTRQMARACEDTDLTLSPIIVSVAAWFSFQSAFHLPLGSFLVWLSDGQSHEDACLGSALIQTRPVCPCYFRYIDVWKKKEGWHALQRCKKEEPCSPYAFDCGMETLTCLLSDSVPHGTAAALPASVSVAICLNFLRLSLLFCFARRLHFSALILQVFHSWVPKSICTKTNSLSFILFVLTNLFSVCIHLYHNFTVRLRMNGRQNDLKKKNESTTPLATRIVAGDHTLESLWDCCTP